jgi:hypothetical protein
MMWDVTIRWTRLGLLSPLWDSDMCLYAYVHPRTKEILYIGKADKMTVHQRWRGPDKGKLFRYFRKELGLTDVRVHQGELELPPGGRRTSQLLSDLEALLIYRLDPPGNISNTATKNSARIGLTVLCVGDWPHRRGGFRDTL